MTRHIWRGQRDIVETLSQCWKHGRGDSWEKSVLATLAKNSLDLTKEEGSQHASGHQYPKVCSVCCLQAVFYRRAAQVSDEGCSGDERCSGHRGYSEFEECLHACVTWYLLTSMTLHMVIQILQAAVAKRNRETFLSFLSLNDHIWHSWHCRAWAVQPCTSPPAWLAHPCVPAGLSRAILLETLPRSILLFSLPLQWFWDIWLWYESWIVTQAFIKLNK